MRASWPTLTTERLIELGLLEIGDGYRAKNVEFGGSGLPFLRIKNMADGGVDLRDADLFPINSLHRVGSKVSRPGDCAIATKATIGRLAFMGADSPKVVYSPQVSYWRVLDHDSLEPQFIRYWLQSREFRDQAQATKGSTAMADYINLRDQRRMRITLPDVTEQRRIGAVLSAYDDLIANNTRRIAILEDMARTVYREWFVEFRYPGHEGVPLVESELGPIPEGWEATTTAGAFGFGGGATPSTKRPDFWDDGTINWYTPSDLTKHGQMFIGESGRKITEAGLDGCSATLFPPGSVMMTSRATLGVVSISETLACTNQGFITCLENERASGFFIYFWLGENARKMESVATGATFKEITKRAFRNVGLVLPNRELMDHFTETVGPMMCLGSSLIAHNAALKSTRDLLLPRLVSGEIDVSDLDIDIGVPL